MMLNPAVFKIGIHALYPGHHGRSGRPIVHYDANAANPFLPLHSMHHSESTPLPLVRFNDHHHHHYAQHPHDRYHRYVRPHDRPHPALPRPPPSPPPAAHAHLSLNAQSSPSLPLWLSLPHPYVLSQAPSSTNLTLLRDSNAKPARPEHELTSDQAIRLVIDCARAYRMQTATAARGERRWWLGASGVGIKKADGEGHWLERIFEDVDEVCFAGVLKGNVCLKIVGGGDSSSGGKDRRGKLPLGARGVTYAPDDDRNRIGIVIDEGVAVAEGSEGEKRMNLLSALMHQMTHAFLLQTTGLRARNDGSGEGKQGHDLGHKDDFATIAYILQKVHAPKAEMGIYPARFGGVSVDKELWEGRDWRKWMADEQEGREVEDGDRSLCVYPVGQKSRRSHEDEWEWGTGVEAWKCKHNFWRVKRGTEKVEIDLDRKCPTDLEGERRSVASTVLENSFANLLSKSDNAVLPFLPTQRQICSEEMEAHPSLCLCIHQRPLHRARVHRLCCSYTPSQPWCVLLPHTEEERVYFQAKNGRRRCICGPLDLSDTRSIWTSAWHWIGHRDSVERPRSGCI